MDYIKIRFGQDLDQLGNKFERDLEDIFRSVSPRFTCTECSWTPPMDIYETEDEIVVLAEVAGVDKEDLDIEINSKAIRVGGRRVDRPRQEKATYRLAEIQCGKFERTLFLPSPINTESVSASYTDGMLKIRLAKLPKERTHRISITED
ncbi:MAG: Hsp20/alpha crystallin family protein [Desulfococcaceae bacterium]